MDQTQGKKAKGELTLAQKVIIVGDSGVGKSCIMSKLIYDRFNEKTQSTQGHDFRNHQVVIDDIVVKMNIFDTAGQEKFRPIIKSYFKGARAAFLVYSLVDEKSFDDLKYWEKELDRGVDRPNIPRILLGNKYDMIDENQIQDAEIKIKEYAKQKQLKYYFTSAKTGLNIKEAFENMAKEILEQNRDFVEMYDQGDSKSSNKKNGTHKLSNNKDKKKEKGCC